VPLGPSVTFFAIRSWAGCIINMSGFDLRQAQAVVGGAFLVAIGLAHTRVHVEHDAVQRTAAVHPVNPSPREIGKRNKVLIIREPLGLEAAHLAGGGCLLRCSTTANDPAHRRITPEPVGVVQRTMIALVPAQNSIRPANRFLQ